MMDFVSWGYELPNMMGKSSNSMVPVTTNQIGFEPGDFGSSSVKNLELKQLKT
jgi:hypothetical protein